MVRKRGREGRERRRCACDVNKERKWHSHGSTYTHMYITQMPPAAATPAARPARPRGRCPPPTSGSSLPSKRVCWSVSFSGRLLPSPHIASPASHTH